MKRSASLRVWARACFAGLRAKILSLINILFLLSMVYNTKKLSSARRHKRSSEDSACAPQLSTFTPPASCSSVIKVSAFYWLPLCPQGFSFSTPCVIISARFICLSPYLPKIGTAPYYTRGITPCDQRSAGIGALQAHTAPALNLIISFAVLVMCFIGSFVRRFKTKTASASACASCFASLHKAHTSAQEIQFVSLRDNFIFFELKRLKSTRLYFAYTSRASKSIKSLKRFHEPLTRKIKRVLKTRFQSKKSFFLINRFC